MSFRDDIQEAIQAGIGALDDIPVRSTYTGKRTPSYNADTGVTTITPTSSLNVPIVFTSYKRKEIDNVAVLPSDQKAIIATLDLDQLPTLNDTITQPDGTVWSVISIGVDPVGAAWVLQIRRP